MGVPLPKVSVVYKEDYPLNFVRSSTAFFDDCDAENENYDADNYGNCSSEIPFSEFVNNISPTMAHQPIFVEAGPGAHNWGTWK